MRFFVVLLCLYFSLLTLLPTVKVVKMYVAEKHQMCCNKSDSDCDSKGCEKEKCLLNYSLNTPTFLVFTTNYSFINNLVFIPKKENIFYHKNFISNYNVTIWQPPESFLMS